jgi:hypothetical protein
MAGPIRRWESSDRSWKFLAERLCGEFQLSSAGRTTGVRVLMSPSTFQLSSAGRTLECGGVHEPRRCSDEMRCVPALLQRAKTSLVSQWTNPGAVCARTGSRSGCAFPSFPFPGIVKHGELILNCLPVWGHLRSTRRQADLRERISQSSSKKGAELRRKQRPRSGI